MSAWDDVIDSRDRDVLSRGRWAGRMGYGNRPALILVDAQNYMVGVRGASDNATAYPLSCETGFAAIDQMGRLLGACRSAGVPAVFTRFVVNPRISDVGMFSRKVGAGLGQGETLFYEGTLGAEISDDLKPRPDEIVIDKKKKSAFFGTPLLSLLLDWRVDTCIVVGGSTSNCVRATVVDSEQYNFFTIVPREAVFDRLPLSHKVSLFDMDRSYADVVAVEEVLAYLGSLGERGAAPARQAAE